MSATDASPAPADAKPNAHPPPAVRDYWFIFFVLVVITAIEVGIIYVDAPRGVIVAVLLSAAVAKFALVVLWYMHLKFDKRIYSRFLLIGIFGAIILYGVVLATFGFVMD
jgi:cytochrome c oxidase subunit 4